MDVVYVGESKGMTLFLYMYSVSQKSSPPPKKKNFLQYFHLGFVYFREILQVYCQYISTHAYQFWSI